MKSRFTKIAGVVVSLAPLASFAAGPTMTGLTGAVEMDTVTTAILAVGAVMVGVAIAYKGAKLVLRAVRGL